MDNEAFTKDTSDAMDKIAQMLGLVVETEEYKKNMGIVKANLSKIQNHYDQYTKDGRSTNYSRMLYFFIDKVEHFINTDAYLWAINEARKHNEK